MPTKQRLALAKGEFATQELRHTTIDHTMNSQRRSGGLLDYELLFNSNHVVDFLILDLTHLSPNSKSLRGDIIY